MRGAIKDIECITVSLGCRPTFVRAPEMTHLDTCFSSAEWRRGTHASDDWPRLSTITLVRMADDNVHIVFRKQDERPLTLS